jgi:hypothetical protein
MASIKASKVFLSYNGNGEQKRRNARCTPGMPMQVGDLDRCIFYLGLNGRRLSKLASNPKTATIDMILISCIFNLYKIKTSKGTHG